MSNPGQQGSTSWVSTLRTSTVEESSSLVSTSALDNASAALFTLPGLYSSMIFGRNGNNLKYHRLTLQVWYEG